MFLKLREDFDHGKTLEETLSKNEDHVHDVATLLKEYFRALPDALLCNDLYQCFIQTQSTHNRINKYLYTFNEYNIITSNFFFRNT